jgi:glycosyltransferase involved in cell wall biosynthesis
LTHIALVIPGIDRIGGAESQVIQLAKGLHKRGWRVTVAALSGTGGSAATELRAAGVEFFSLEMRKGLADPRGWLRWNRWLKLESPDVIHAHLPHAAWLVRWSRLAFKCRVVIDTVHSCSTGSLSRKLGYRLSSWLTDRVTAVSSAAAEAHLAARMVSGSELSILPNGIDGDEWRGNPEARKAARQELGVQHEFLWLAAGRLDPVKDYPTLLAAMAKVPKPALLLIAGAGRLHAQLVQLTARLGIAERVRFLGFRSDLNRMMQAADGFVLSSRWEGLPMGLLEAGACGLPLVATTVPGTLEVIVDGLTGLLATAGDASALTQSMMRIMHMPQEQREAMGDRARKHIIEEFSLEAVLDRWEALYRGLLERDHRPMRRGRG